MIFVYNIYYFYRLHAVQSFKLGHLGMLTLTVPQGTIYPLFSDRRRFSSINFTEKKSYWKLLLFKVNARVAGLAAEMNSALVWRICVASLL